MGVVSPIIADPMPNALMENIAICATTLLLVTNASVEIITMTCIHPKRNSTLWKEIVDELGDGTVDMPHHRTELIPVFAVAQQVIMIV